MTTARAGHTATLLLNGKVLITGGWSFGARARTDPNVSATPSAELYDPSTGTFTPTGNMTTPRRDHTASLLPDGRVLITGGYRDSSHTSALRDAELYDPSAGTFTGTGVMFAGGKRPAVLLTNGKVLITGGPFAELYDPAIGDFVTTGAYAGTSREPPRSPSVHTATLLPDGRVLIAFCEDPQLYDPFTGAFGLTGPMTERDRCDRVYETVTLTNGKVLFVGTVDSNYIAAAEVYDPATGTFADLKKTTPRFLATATPLPDGTVLIAGAQLPGGTGDSSVELYDPETGAFATAGNMTTGRHSHTATLLPDGTVLIAGGFFSWGGQPSLASAELYHPAVRDSPGKDRSIGGDISERRAEAFSIRGREDYAAVENSSRQSSPRRDARSTRSQPATILTIDVDNAVVYTYDVSDYSKFATDPNITRPIAARPFFARIVVGDIVAVNDKPAKGVYVARAIDISARVNVTPGRSIADVPRAIVEDDTFEILQPDGTPVGTIMIAGLGSGPVPPGAPVASSESNFAVVGGTGAFLAVRGQAGIARVARRFASVTEDPAYRRILGGAPRRFVLHLIPQSQPQIVTTPSGPAVFHADFSSVTATNPARAGEVLIAMASGLGPTRPGVDPGQPFPPDATHEVNSPVDVKVNGEAADVINKIGWPGLVDTYRVAFRLRDGATDGTATIQLSVAWIAGLSVTIPVRASTPARE